MRVQLMHLYVFTCGCRKLQTVVGDKHGMCVVGTPRAGMHCQVDPDSGLFVSRVNGTWPCVTGTPLTYQVYFFRAGGRFVPCVR